MTGSHQYVTSEGLVWAPIKVGRMMRVAMRPQSSATTSLPAKIMNSPTPVTAATRRMLRMMSMKASRAARQKHLPVSAIWVNGRREGRGATGRGEGARDCVVDRTRQIR